MCSKWNDERKSILHVLFILISPEPTLYEEIYINETKATKPTIKLISSDNNHKILIKIDFSASRNTIRIICHPPPPISKKKRTVYTILWSGKPN